MNLSLQTVLNLSAFGSGLTPLPMTLVIMVMMVRLSGPLIGRFGVKPVLVTGLLALAMSLALFSAMPADGTFVGNVLPVSLLAAVGMSMAFIPVTMTGMGGASPQDTGLASGLINTTYRRIGPWSGGDGLAVRLDARCLVPASGGSGRG